MSVADTKKRIASVFGTDKVPKVTSETLVTYRDYLSEHLRPGIRLTGPTLKSEFDSRWPHQREVAGSNPACSELHI